MDLSELTSKKNSVLAQILASNYLPEIEEIRVNFLGKNGVITSYLKQLATVSSSEKAQAGAELNSIKNEVSAALDNKKRFLDQVEIDKKLAFDKLDLTLPARNIPEGKIHPISQVIDEVIAIFGSLGFFVAEGPSIENDFNNFTALNIPLSHPARQMHDTFYLKDGKSPEKMLLRTHTSTVQIRNMQANKPPFRFVSPGRVYRCDWDMTHTPMFHQIEAVLIDKNIHMGHLKSCITEFLKIFFEIDDVPIRFRASYFPFTEPSAEVDIGCAWQGKELIIGKEEKWLEILGCGMVHPNVLRSVGVDPDIYQGFALGMGIERIAMLKYGIGDLRNFFDSDLRWLSHYGFSPFDIPSLIGGLTR